ncbi:MAG: hypothetical protein AMJ90_02495 [candidate division Zixibacteria bacterium SM23_73_2]|nr:MAG: hypothetical protein AMJ90_02495 [candidate division Zixibacteria bacterium SM23_73_2]
MKRSILFLALISVFLILAFNSTWGQDPGDPDTVWIYGVPMSQTWNQFQVRPLPFSVVCSVWTDQSLYGLSFAISYYHSENRDILCDSILWESWALGYSPALIFPEPANVGDPDVCRRDSIWDANYTPKVISPGLVWFMGTGLPATSGKQKLFTAYFNGDHTQVPNWDTTKSIVLDSTVGKPGGPVHLQFTDIDSKTYSPVFRSGVIGEKATISGTALESDGTTPDVGVFVYARGKDVTTSFFPGRICSTETDGSGNFQFTLGKGGYWCVFRDTSSALIPGTNAFCFAPLTSNVSGLIFEGNSGVEEEEGKEAVLPENFTLFQNYPNPFNPTTVIKFYLPEDSWVKVEVFNLLGQRVKTLADKAMLSGIREVLWNGKNEKGKSVASGIYFYKVKTDKFEDMKKMILLK